MDSLEERHNTGNCEQIVNCFTYGYFAQFCFFERVKLFRALAKHLWNTYISEKLIKKIQIYQMERYCCFHSTPTGEKLQWKVAQVYARMFMLVSPVMNCTILASCHQSSTTCSSAGSWKVGSKGLHIHNQLCWAPTGYCEMSGNSLEWHRTQCKRLAKVKTEAYVESF